MKKAPSTLSSEADYEDFRSFDVQEAKEAIDHTNFPRAGSLNIYQENPYAF
ncbi:MAG TPA: hypothetical protein GXX25_06565 [Desulfotomaculum sp.]|nr:hypothetical protein [Desulfotomaculum sp.]